MFGATLRPKPSNRWLGTVDGQDAAQLTEPRAQETLQRVCGVGFEKDPAPKAKVARARIYPSGPNVARFEFINKSQGLTPRWGTGGGGTSQTISKFHVARVALPIACAPHGHAPSPPDLNVGSDCRASSRMENKVRRPH